MAVQKISQRLDGFSLAALLVMTLTACGSDSSAVGTTDTAADSGDVEIGVDLGADGDDETGPRVPADDGAACETAQDCLSGTCLSEADGFPGGMCTTADCEAREDCSGLGRACLAGEFNGNLCVALCGDDGDCRDGWECSGREEGGYCYPPFVATAWNPQCVSNLIEEDGLVSGFFEPMDLHEIAFEIGPDTESFAVMVYNRRDEVLPERLIAPSGDSLGLIDEYLFFSTTVFGLGNIAPVFVPAGSEWVEWVQPGEYQMRVGTTGDEVCFFVLESDQPGSVIDFNFYFVGVPGLNATTADRDPDFQQMLSFFDDTMAVANLELGRVRYFDVVGDIEDEFEVIRSESEVFELMRLSRPPGQSLEDLRSVNVFFVRGFAGQMFSVLGVAPGVPAVMGIHGQEGTGLIFSAENLGGLEGNRLVGQVLAHELGHFLGLAHTTETSGRQADWLADTPECTNIRRESLENCPDFANLMFPIASFRDTVELSDDQVLILRANPLVDSGGAVE